MTNQADMTILSQGSTLGGLEPGLRSVIVRHCFLAVLMAVMLALPFSPAWSQVVNEVVNDRNRTSTVVVNAGERFINPGEFSIVTEGVGEHGILGGDNVEVINNGIIILRGGAGDREIIAVGDGDGIRVGTDGRVTNNGVIIARDGASIRFLGIGGEVTLGPYSFLQGPIALNSTSVIIDLGNRGGLSKILRGNGPLNPNVGGDRGVRLEVLNDRGQYFYNGSGGTPSRLLVTIDPTVFTLQWDHLALTSQLVADTVVGMDRQSVALAGSQSRWRAWASAMGQARSLDEGFGFNKTSHDMIGGLFGLDYRPMGDHLTGGVFIGYGHGQQESTAFMGVLGDLRSFESDSNSVIGGVYGRGRHGDWFADASLSLGGTNFDHRRSINSDAEIEGDGLLTARGSHGSFWLSPHLSLGRHIALSGSWRATPRVFATYGVQWFDGYRESGGVSEAYIFDAAAGPFALDNHVGDRGAGDGNATVSSYNAAVLSGGVEMAVSRSWEDHGTITMALGYRAYGSTGDNDRRIEMAGVSKEVQAQHQSRHSLTLGLGGEVVLNEKLRLNLKANGLIGNKHRGGGGQLSFIAAF